jgi:hypothetical protein
MRDITFTLVVDDFGIKYTNQDDLDHLLAALHKHYTISVDLTGSKYLGLDIAWDYYNRTNGLVAVISHILNVILSSRRSQNRRSLLQLPRGVRTCLAEMGHPQPTPPVMTNISTAAGTCNDTIKQGCSKAMDMRFYWVRNHI